MAYITKFGTSWGVPPFTQGRVLFVAPSSPYTVDGRSYDASDDNDGESPERALLTVARGIVLAGISRGGASISNAGETIALLPGTHTATALLRMQNAGVSLVGLPAPRFPVMSAYGAGTRKPAAVLTSSSSTQPLLSVEADNIEIANVTLRPPVGFSSVIFRNQKNGGPDNLHIHDVHLDLRGSDVNTRGIDFAYRADTSTAAGAGYEAKGTGGTGVATAYVERLYALARGTVGPAIEIASANVVVRDSWFHNSSGAWARAIAVATSTRDSVIDGCIFTTTGTMTACIDGTTADVALGVLISHNKFPAATQSVAVDNFATPGTEAVLIENYAGGHGSGDGGLLVRTVT